MDESGSIELSDSTLVVDLTLAGDPIDAAACEKKEVTAEKEVPMYIISDEEWLNSLPDTERNWYERNSTTSKDIDGRTIVCTACFKQTNHRNLGDVCRHPTLGVPICKNCKNFYFDGAWTKDEEGSFEFCGWCAQGGELLICGNERYA